MVAHLNLLVKIRSGRHAPCPEELDRTLVFPGTGIPYTLELSEPGEDLRDGTWGPVTSTRVSF